MLLLVVRAFLVAVALGALAGIAAPAPTFAGAPDLRGGAFLALGEQLAHVELLNPVPARDLSALESQLGVQVLQFQHQHPGPYTTLTAGGVVSPGQSLAVAADQHLANQARWFTVKLASLEALSRDLGGQRRLALLRTIEDIKVAQADFEQNGARVNRLVVRGVPEAIAALASKPNVASVGVK